MLVLTYLLLDSNRTYGDDVFLIKYSSIIKKLVLKIDPKPNRNELLFINISYDPVFIEKLDKDSIPIGLQTITDREKVAKLFEILNKNPDNYKYIICDIFFKDGSPNDSLLHEQLKKAKNTIIPYHAGGENLLDMPLFDVKKGFADYDYIEGSFLKFKLLHRDTIQSIPLVMYKDLYGVKYEKKGMFYFLNDKLSFNNIILDFKVRYYDILGNGSNNNYPFVYLGEFIELPDSLINVTVKDKIILIGDFLEKDVHETIFGKMPGTIILLNAYLTLVNEDNIIPILFFPYLFVCYFFLSYLVFNKDKKISNIIYKMKEKFMFKKSPDEEKETTFQKTKTRGVFKKASLFILVSFISYLIFNIHINVLILTLFLEAEKFFYSLYQKRKKQLIIKKI